MDTAETSSSLQQSLQPSLTLEQSLQPSLTLEQSLQPSLTLTEADLEDIFLKTLDEKELMAYNIAKSHLGTLFSLDKSNAFLEWKAKQK
jgi:hypothetical protein